MVDVSKVAVTLKAVPAVVCFGVNTEVPVNIGFISIRSPVPVAMEVWLVSSL